MFRRKEESEGLFDTTETATTAATSSAPAASPATTAAATTSTASAPAASAPVSRPLPETRITTTQSASTFRPNTGAIGDMTRNRLPETKAPAAAGADKKSARRVLTVGNDILLKGEIATCDRLVIEGKVDATLNEVHTVEIAEHGSFKGAAHIEEAEISGLFEGELIVRGRLVIYATGKVRGKISYGEVEIERGGELTGEIKMGGQAGARPARVKDDKVAA